MARLASGSRPGHPEFPRSSWRNQGSCPEQQSRFAQIPHSAKPRRDQETGRAATMLTHSLTATGSPAPSWARDIAARQLPREETLLQCVEDHFA
jgi:hypothetical protein